MESENATSKLPWVMPQAVALTDTESRADQPDVGIRNGNISPGG
jgi:hypothetical protein